MHREREYRRGIVRLPGYLIARLVGGWARLWVRLWCLLLLRSIRGDEAHVAIYRIGSIGDMVHALPALAAIRRRHPRAHLTLVTNAAEGEPWPARLGMPSGIDLSIVAYKTPHELKEAIAAAACVYYLAPHPLGLRRALRDMLFFRGRATGFDALTPRGWVARALRPWREAEPQYQRLLRACGLTDGPQAPWPQTATDLPPAPYVVLAACGKSAVQLWPDERYRELAQRLSAAGMTPVWVGGAEDAARLGELPGERRFELPFDQLRRLLSSAKCVVGNDSGLVHLAAYIGARVVVISSARAAAYAWRPMGSATVLRRDMNCEACHLRECSDVACITAISVDEVWNAVAVR